MAVRVPLWNDSGNRADGGIGSRYNTLGSGVEVFSNEFRVGTPVNVYSLAQWAGQIPNRQYAKVVLRAVGGSVDSWGLMLRYDLPTADSGYFFFCTGGTTNNVRIYKREAGALTLFTQASVAAWQVGDSMEFEADGNVLTALRNGSSLLSYNDTAATFTSGKAGLWFNLDGASSQSTVRTDDLEIGELRDTAPDFGSRVRSQLATDPFTGADSSDIGAAWDVYTGANNLQRVSNRVRVGVENSRCLEGYNAQIPGPHQYCGVTVGPAWASGGDFAILLVRGTAPASAQSGYCALLFPGIPFVEIRRIDTGSMTSPLAGKDVQVAAGDTCYLEADGQAIKLWVNSTKVAQLYDAANTYASGRTGLGINVPSGGGANIEVDNFVMGNLVFSEVVQAGPIIFSPSALDSLVLAPSPSTPAATIIGTVPFLRRRRRMPWGLS